MKRWSAILVLVIAFSLLIPAIIVHAGGIEVVSVTDKTNFPTDITFNLSVKASTKIQSIVFYYKPDDDFATHYGNPDFNPSTQVDTQYKLITGGGSLPPTSKITYYWQIQDSEGNVVNTPAKEISYEDTRFQWKSVGRDGLTIEWYQGTQDQANQLLDAAVSALNRLSEQAGIKYEKPVRILVYNSKNDMSAVVPQRSQSFDQQISTLGIRLTPEVLAVLGSDSGIKQTLAHELSHEVIAQAVDNPYGDIPLWLDEGLAMNAEGDMPSRNKSALNDGIRKDNLIAVRSLTSYSSAEMVDLYYGEVYSVVRYLTDTYGKDKMGQLLGVFKEGTGYDDALQKVYGLDMDQLDAQWRQSIGAKPRNLDQVEPSTTRNDSGSTLPLGFQELGNFSPFVLALGAVLSGFLGIIFFAIGGIVFLLGRNRNNTSIGS